jgi:hypothetical protein
MAHRQSPFGGDGNLCGHRPQKPHQCTGNGHDHLVGMFASSDQAAVAFTPPTLCLPADILDGFGWPFEPQLQMSTELGRIALGPGPFNKSTTGMGMARFGNGTLAPPLTGGRLRGNQPQAFHEFSGSIEARQVAEFGHRGDRSRALYTAECLKGLDHRVHAPRFDLLVAFLVETLEAFGMLVDGADVFLEGHLLRGGGTADFGEPPQRGGVPGGPARVADIMSAQEGVEPELGGLAMAEGIFMGAGESPDGFIFALGDID